MVRRVSRRLGLLAGFLIAGGLPLAQGDPAYAAPPPAPTSVTISGDGMVRPLTIRADTDASAFGAIIDQVSWLEGAGQGDAPMETNLGPEYVVVVLVGDGTKHSYRLYPLAKGGPRAFRPAGQRNQRYTAAWFFGRLTMPEALRAAGVTLPGQYNTVRGALGNGGGIGGGARATPAETISPGGYLDRLFGELRRVLLFNTAVIVVITAGLAGISLLVHRRTR
jgi:hypothetical protein